MYHKVILVGNLGRDPEMRYTPSGEAVTNFSMATSEKWTGKDGQPAERTLWWRVSVFGKHGEACNTYLKKGSKVLVEGRMVADENTGGPRVFERNDGSAGAAFEVRAKEVKFLGDGGRGGNGSSQQHEAAGEVAPEEDGVEIPF